MSTTLVENVTAHINNTLILRGSQHDTNEDEQPRKVLGSPPSDYRYARFLPSYDQNYKLPPLEPFEHVDPGHAALSDADPQSFLRGSSVTRLTPRFGTEVTGVQLSSLGEREKR
jgi:sulfonate dioxygenase